MRKYKGQYNGQPVIMISDGQMSDGSKTYIKAKCYVDFTIIPESDGYYRQYQKDRYNNFYLLTEDK